MRTILHVDMDAFFCAVETRFHPEYAGKPLIVGGYRDTPRAVVSSCSYEARRYGVHSAMPLAQAAKLCPHGIFVPPNMQLYRQVSHVLHAVFRQFSPLVEPVSIDEAFIDMTGCEHFYPSLEVLARTVQEKVFAAVQCPASIGIAPNKFLAKLASDLRKPRGLVVIRPDEVDSILLPLPVTKLWGVGESTAAVLNRAGVHTVADLRQRSRQWLTERLGKAGAVLYDLARGIDHRPVTAPGPAKSIGHEITFDTDLSDRTAITRELELIAAEVGRRLQQDGRCGKTVTLKVRYRDFTTVTRQHRVPEGLRSASQIVAAARQLLRHMTLPQPVRLLGLYVSQLSSYRQLGLFTDPRQLVIEDLMRKLNTAPHLPPITTAATLGSKNAKDP